MNYHILQLFGEDGAAEAVAPEAAVGEAPAAGETPAEPAEAPVQDAPEAASQPDPDAYDRALRYYAARSALARQQFAIWNQQAEEARADYPELDMNEQTKNPQFRRYLHAGLDVRSAYVLTNLQKIMEQNARQVEASIAQRMMVASTRPRENGGAAQASAVTVADVAGMSRKERQAIARRAAKGEKVRF